MTRLQKIYRLLRRDAGVSREDARDFAPRIGAMTWAQLEDIRAFGA